MAASNPIPGVPGGPSTRPEMRKLLESVLPTDTDLDVFVGDYCNDVYRSFTNGMRRPDKVSLLLDKLPLDRLAELLYEAHPAARILPRQVQPAPSSSGATGPALPAKPARFVGRDELDAALTAALLEEAPKPVVILGGAGIGKSTLTLSVLHRPEIASRYGDRRYFVRLDAAKTADAAVSAIAVAMRLSGGGDPRASVLAALKREAAVLVLDNGETPWDYDRDSTEALLGELASVPGLALVISVRGAAPPDGADWTLLEVGPLDDVRALDLFCRIAPKYVHLRDDPALVALMKEVAGVPLAVTLLGHAAQGCTLRVLVDDWKHQRTALLARSGSNPDRLSSWAVSIELSMGSPRMTVAARRMASLLGVLPDGAAEEDLAALLPKQGPAAARMLAQMGLAYFENERLVMLAPIREHVALEHPVAGGDLERVMKWYGWLSVTLGETPGRPGGKEALARLVPEAANLDAMIRRGLDGQNSVAWIDVSLALKQYVRFSVRPYPCPLNHALDVARTQGEQLFEARCVECLGDLALRRPDFPGARERYKEALGLYRNLQNLQREINCIRQLGDIASRQQEHDDARRWYEEALPLYQQVKDVLGEANCIRSFGDLALYRSEDNEAKGYYETALLLFRQVGDVLGEANSIQGLGNVMFNQAEYEKARSLYENALLLYRQIGELRGEANCLVLLGHIAVTYPQSDEARMYYEKAIELYSLIHDPCALGLAHCELARLKQDAAEKARHLAAARQCWTSIDRSDLIASLDAEFPPA